MLFKTKAPGSLMIMGEHSVLYGHPSIVAAIDKYIEVTITQNFDQKIYITSDRFPDYSSDIKDIKYNSDYVLILDGIKYYLQSISSGITITIKSDFSPLLGLGSSAAVLVALLSSLQLMAQGHINKNKLFKEGLEIIRNRQIFASGSDLVASIYGNVLHFNPSNHHVEVLSNDLPLVVVYSGSKVSTTKVIHDLNLRFKEHKHIMHKIYKVAGAITDLSSKAIRNKDYNSLGILMNIFNEVIYKSLGLQTKCLKEIIQKLKSSSLIYGTKISGAGMGDCVIALSRQPYSFGNQELQIKVSNNGVLQI